MNSAQDEEALKRQEFYQTVQENQKVEFINGEVVVQSPVKLRHDSVSGAFFRLISTFVMVHDLGHVGHEKLLVSLTRNDYEPDVCFFSKDKARSFKPDQMKFPAPDFIAEILSESTEKIDRGIKFTDYAAHGVLEYWLIDPESESVEQYVIKNDAYKLQVKSGTGLVTSVAIPGFEIPVRSIFEQKQNLSVLLAISLAK
jgi:Uma2 family endonuclease